MSGLGVVSGKGGTRHSDGTRCGVKGGAGTRCGVREFTAEAGLAQRGNHTTGATKKGHGVWGMGYGAWGMGHGAWGMGHGAWGTRIACPLPRAACHGPVVMGQ